MYDQILYPTDGSTGSEAAAEHVEELASAFDATVHVLSVVDTRHVAIGMGEAFLADDGVALSSDPSSGAEGGTVGGTADIDERRSVLRERGEAIVEEASAALGGIETATAVESGDPHATILEYADGNDIDLIVMGTHGRTGLDRYLLGSVTEKVVRMADPPVVTVRADESADE
ncbi:universal stress protein [Halorubrum lipolyticum]|uniref:UspA domain protein n=1 Tax=Halorubrum lipolyticum DSM 21995 TaxID=1227482 RepID=M0P1J2_9EURY|nr:universal stress protein [Halorubrum lipolyticum]EMA62670.1 UspA domain protein [Halorubrum lipolyticum DSM 21995]